MSTETIATTWNEDGSATVYGRLMARDGTGAAIRGEGKALKKADLNSITYKTYEEGNPSAVVNSGTVDLNSCVFDILQTTTDDSVWAFTKGFNFRHDLAPANFPEGGKIYIVEYRFQTNGGTVGWVRFRGPAKNAFSS